MNAFYDIREETSRGKIDWKFTEYAGFVADLPGSKEPLFDLIMSCHVMSCYVMSCYVMLCDVI